MTRSFGMTFAARAGNIVDFPDPVGALTTKNLHVLSLFKNSSRTAHAEGLLVGRMMFLVEMCSQEMDQSDKYSALIDQHLMYLFLGPRPSFSRLVTMPIPGLLFEHQYLDQSYSFVPFLHLER